MAGNAIGIFCSSILIDLPYSRTFGYIICDPWYLHYDLNALANHIESIHNLLEFKRQLMANEITKEHNDFIVRNYFNFEERDEQDRVLCKCCENYLKDNSGHTNLISHVKQNHIAHQVEKLQEKEEVQARKGMTFLTIQNLMIVSNV